MASYEVFQMVFNGVKHKVYREVFYKILLRVVFMIVLRFVDRLLFKIWFTRFFWVPGFLHRNPFFKKQESAGNSRILGSDFSFMGTLLGCVYIYIIYIYLFIYFIYIYIRGVHGVSQ